MLAVVDYEKSAPPASEKLMNIRLLPPLQITSCLPCDWAKDEGRGMSPNQHKIYIVWKLKFQDVVRTAVYFFHAVSRPVSDPRQS